MRLIPWLIASLLCLFHLPVVVGYTGLLGYAGSGVTLAAILYWLLVLASGLYLILGMIKPAFRNGRIFTTCNLAVLVSLSAVLVWLFTDDKPLGDDYTVADTCTRANGSYQYLDIFNRGDAEALARINATLENRDQTEAAWRRIIKYRQAVDALDQFDTICDLPPDAPLDMDMPFLNFRALKNTADIYYRYLNYKVAQGQGSEAVEEVSRFYGFARKSLPHASILVNKMVFLALADMSFNKTYDAISHHRCGMRTIEFLRGLYTPLEPDEFSLARAFIGEYLVIKKTMQRQVQPDTFLDTAAMSSTRDPSQSPAFPMASRIAYYVSFKPNMSQREIKQTFDLLIEAQKSAPPDYSAVNRHIETYRRHPQLRNMAGWVLNTIAMPDYAPFSSRGVKTKIRSDLLAMALHKKAGRQLEIKDYYTRGPYRYKEEPGIIRHPGQDGQYNTDDDIILGTLPQE